MSELATPPITPADKIRWLSGSDSALTPARYLERVPGGGDSAADKASDGGSRSAGANARAAEVGDTMDRFILSPTAGRPPEDCRASATTLTRTGSIRALQLPERQKQHHKSDWRFGTRKAWGGITPTAPPAKKAATSSDSSGGFD